MVAPHLSSTQRVLVSYSAPSQLLTSQSWNSVHATLLAQLPLRNIHWKSAARTSVKTIQELDVSLVSLDSVRDEHTSQIPGTLLDKPLLHLYIVPCEDNDLENYRNVVKKQIKEWHSMISGRKHQDWLIIQIYRPEAVRTPAGNFFQKGTVLDKIKTDFNSEKRDRCVQVNWNTSAENPLAWAEVLNKMKDGVMHAFDSAIIQRHDEVRRSEGQQQMPGWNFCTFFILKESLATSFESMNILDESLLQYDELETSFYRVWRERSLSWFGNLINAGPRDDSAPLLSITKKPYRDLILANTISVFDFRIYLLARQCELLAKMGRLNEVTTKVGAFLGAFGNRLRELEADLPSFFVESWVYSSALSVVDQCDTWSSAHKQETTRLPAIHAGQGELLELARRQLDAVGIRAQHLPARYPFLVTARSDKPTRSKSIISNSELLKVIQDRDAFYHLYVNITKRAIDLYTKAGRRKFALKLHGSLASLDLHRERLSAALSTYNSLPPHYAPHMWTSLESFMLSKALDTHRKLNQPHDVEWIHILLSFLKTYIDHGGEDLLMHEDDKVEYVSKLIAAMKVAASDLETDHPHPDHAAISFTIPNHARLADSKDGSYISVSIRNHLPCAFPADQVNVILAGRDSDKIHFTASAEEIPPGKSELTLFCPNPMMGTYMLESTEIRLSRLLFQWIHRKSSKRISSLVQSKQPQLVRIPQDPLALDLNLSPPNRIELGQPSMLIVTLTTGRNNVSNITIRISSPGITFKCKGVIMVDYDQDIEPFEKSEDTIVFKDIRSDTTLPFSIPHSDSSGLQTTKINLDFEYTTVSEPTVVRRVKLARSLMTTLPIAVNVEDFFRGTRLITKFTVSTASHQHVRILDAALEIPGGHLDGLKITSCSAKNRGVITVTPIQPANFLFALDAENGSIRESLSLSIKFRMLREEVEYLIEEQVGILLVLEDSSVSQIQRITLVNMLIDALERDAAWVHLYGITGELIVPEIQHDDRRIQDLFDKARKLLRNHAHSVPPSGKWREIRIPVDIPNMDIVAAVQISLISTPSPMNSEAEKLTLYAGQPISAVLNIHTSFHWGFDDKDQTYIMRYNVEDMARDWLVSGPKRGDFVAMDGATHVVPFTLIALHHGELTLPKVQVTPLPLAGRMTMESKGLPTTETYQVHGVEKVLVLPRGGRSTFVLTMGSG